MGFLGIGGSTTGAVVSGVTSFASDYYENRDFTSAVINGAVSAGISLILNPLASMGPEKRGYLEYMRKDQIYFADKKRTDGSSELYSVTDFTTKTADNIRKGYLAGKYGATPKLEIEEVE